MEIIAVYRISRTFDYKLINKCNIDIFGESLKMDSSKHECWIIKKDGIPVGFGTVKDVGDSTVFLSRAGIYREHRGNGLQKRLIRTRVRFAKKSGYKTVITYTMPDNFMSFGSLQSCGFFLYYPAVLWAGSGMLYWKKDIG